MTEKLNIIFGLLGGLAVFLFGMNLMSECLQKAAGEKMKARRSLLLDFCSLVLRPWAVS